MYRSVGIENKGSPYKRATATWSTTVGMPWLSTNAMLDETSVGVLMRVVLYA
jgi:hypothetical protein